MIITLIFSCSQLTLADQIFDETKVKAEQEDIIAQYTLGLMYSQGKGIDQDYSKAFDLYRKAAAQGQTDKLRFF